MGVPGLWDVLRPAGKTRSLIHLAIVDGFDKNREGKRGYRVGIDASIWFFHAQWGREGENPELRTLFFRLCRLSEAAFLPLFVFDGPYRPEFKRGKKISNKQQHWLESGTKRLVEAFGFEWREAPGEAEAELAYLNRIGVIDAVLSDDVDTFLFGARVVVRNPSNTLSGNRANPVMNADGRDDGKHVVIYHADDIESREDIDLTRNGLILIGLLSGGDYHQAGIMGCGKLIAHGLARCGLGDELVNGVLKTPADQLDGFLTEWRASLAEELRTNSRGIIGKKYKALAAKIPDTFPDLAVLRSYMTPLTTESRGRQLDVSSWWMREMDVAEIGLCCEQYFEWGIKDIIIKRFRTVLWPGVCLRILRKAAMEQDLKMVAGEPLTPKKNQKGPSKRYAIGTPSKLITKYFSKMGINSPQKSGAGEVDDEEDVDMLMIKIHSSRKHASTDHILEYRVEVAPAQLVELAGSALQGTRNPEHLGRGETYSDLEGDDDEEGGAKKGKPPPDPLSHLRIWLPASMLEYVQPSLVEEFEAKEEAKRLKKEGKGKGKAKKADEDDTPKKKPAKAPPKPKGKKIVRKPFESTTEEEEEDEDEVPASKRPQPAAAKRGPRTASPSPTAPTAKPKPAASRRVPAPGVPKPTKPAAAGRARSVLISEEEEELSEEAAKPKVAPRKAPKTTAGMPTKPPKKAATERARSAFISEEDETLSDADVPSRLRKSSPAAPRRPSPPLKLAFTMACPDVSDGDDEPIPLRPKESRAKYLLDIANREILGVPDGRKPQAKEKVAKVSKPKVVPSVTLPKVADFFNDDLSSATDDVFLPRAGSSRSVSSGTTAVSKTRPPSRVAEKPRSPSVSEEEETIRKSPKKSENHSSPRKVDERPASPTPPRPKGSAIPTEYIEISSDDDEEIAPPKLLSFKNKQKLPQPQTKSLGTYGFGVKKSSSASAREKVSMDDPIDLT